MRKVKAKVTLESFPIHALHLSRLINISLESEIKWMPVVSFPLEKMHLYKAAKKDVSSQILHRLGFKGKSGYLLI